LHKQFYSLAHTKNIEFTVLPTQVMVLTDGFQLDRVISNLISNAIRFTPCDGKVYVRCRQRLGTAWIQIWDTGIGIGDKEKDKIFDEFYQISSRKNYSQNTGLGLGLYIVKRITQRLKFSISLRSRLERGTLMAIGVPSCAMELAHTIAFDYATSIQAGGDGSLADLLRGLLVLVIEDDARVLGDMEIFLKSYQCTVLSASSAQIALTMVENTLRTPDLIISDYQLGDQKNGAQVIQTIRQNLDDQVPAILITAEYIANDQDRQKFGNIPVLSKPVNLSLLIKILQDILPSGSQ
jgi:CheY-like chemotaxis protein